MSSNTWETPVTLNDLVNGQMRLWAALANGEIDYRTAKEMNNSSGKVNQLVTAAYKIATASSVGVKVSLTALSESQDGEAPTLRHRQ